MSKKATAFKRRVPASTAPFDAYDESDGTEKAARAGYLQGVGQ